MLLLLQSFQVGCTLRKNIGQQTITYCANQVYGNMKINEQITFDNNSVQTATVFLIAPDNKIRNMALDLNITAKQQNFLLMPIIFAEVVIYNVSMNINITNALNSSLFRKTNKFLMEKCVIEYTSNAQKGDGAFVTPYASLNLTFINANMTIKITAEKASLIALVAQQSLVFYNTTLNNSALNQKDPDAGGLIYQLTGKNVAINITNSTIQMAVDTVSGKLVGLSTNVIIFARNVEYCITSNQDSVCKDPATCTMNINPDNVFEICGVCQQIYIPTAVGINVIAYVSVGGELTAIRDIDSTSNVDITLSTQSLDSKTEYSTFPSKFTCFHDINIRVAHAKTTATNCSIFVLQSNNLYMANINLTYTQQINSFSQNLVGFSFSAKNTFFYNISIIYSNPSFTSSNGTYIGLVNATESTFIRNLDMNITVGQLSTKAYSGLINNTVSTNVFENIQISSNYLTTTSQDNTIGINNSQQSATYNISNISITIKYIKLGVNGGGLFGTNRAKQTIASNVTLQFESVSITYSGANGTVSSYAWFCVDCYTQSLDLRNITNEQSYSYNLSKTTGNISLCFFIFNTGNDTILSLSDYVENIKLRDRMYHTVGTYKCTLCNINASLSTISNFESQWSNTIETDHIYKGTHVYGIFGCIHTGNQEFTLRNSSIQLDNKNITATGHNTTFIINLWSGVFGIVKNTQKFLLQDMDVKNTQVTMGRNGTYYVSTGFICSLQSNTNQAQLTNITLVQNLTRNSGATPNSNDTGGIVAYVYESNILLNNIQISGFVNGSSYSSSVFGYIENDDDKNTIQANNMEVSFQTSSGSSKFGPLVGYLNDDGVLNAQNIVVNGTSTNCINTNHGDFNTVNVTGCTK